MIDPALVDADDLDALAQSRMSGAPSLSFRVEFEGGARLVPVTFSEDEELRLRMYVRDHASAIAEAFLELLEAWCQR